MGIQTKDGRPWTCSGGGPVLVIPSELAATWRGTLPPLGAEVPAGWTWGSGDGPECDYDRACDPCDRIGTPFGGFGWVPVGEGKALALDGEVVTYYLAEGDGRGTLARPSYADTPFDPSAVPEGAWRPFPGGPIELREGRLFMFDSAYEGAADPEAIRAYDGVGVIELGPGRYALDCATDTAEVDYVRFRRL